MAHRGITVADVPNLFILVGPEYRAGAQLGGVHDRVADSLRRATAIAAADKVGAQALAPSRAAQDHFNDKLQRDLSTTVWNTGGCRSWYFDEHGVNRALWSGLASEYWLATRSFKPSEYKFFGIGLDTKTQRVAVPEVVGPQG